MQRTLGPAGQKASGVSYRSHGHTRGSKHHAARGVATAVASRLYSLADELLLGESAADAVEAAANTLASAVTAVAEEAAPVAPTTTYKLTPPSVANYPSLAPKPPPGPKPNTGLELPKVELPKFDSFEMPKFESIEMPKLDSLAMPKFDGSLEMPKLQAPDFSGTFSGIAGSASNASDAVGRSISGGLQGVVDSVTGVTDATTSSISAATSGVSSAISGTVGEVTGSVQAALQSVEGAVSGTVSQVAGAAADTYSSLPPEAQLVLGKLGEAAKLAAAYPLPTLAVTGAVAVPLGVSWYKKRYGGYSGDLAPEAVADALYAEESDVVLVDVREEAQREQEGIPELRGVSRTRAGAMPLSYGRSLVPTFASRRDDLALAISAALIAGAKWVSGPLNKVVILDSTGGEKAREVARALRREGVYQVYVLEGGVRGWAAAGLPVVEGESDYDASQRAILGDAIEDIQEKVKATVQEVSKPQVGIPLAGASALAVVAVINYHITLELIGMAGIAWSIYDGSMLRTAKKAAKAVGKAASGVAGAAKAGAAKRSAASVSKPASRNGAAALPAPGPMEVSAGAAAAAAASVANGAAAANDAVGEEGAVPAQKEEATA